MGRLLVINYLLNNLHSLQQVHVLANLDVFGLRRHPCGYLENVKDPVDEGLQLLVILLGVLREEHAQLILEESAERVHLLFKDQREFGLHDFVLFLGLRLEINKVLSSKLVIER